MSGPCPTCKGRDTIIDPLSGSEEAYTCPDCAGTGKAENSITANEKLREAAPRLAAALKAMTEVFRPRGEPGPDAHVEQAAWDDALAALREAGVDDANA